MIDAKPDRREIYMTNGLGILLEHWKSTLTADQFDKLVAHIGQQFNTVQKEMAALKSGKDRAKWAHKFLQYAIDREKEATANAQCKRGCSACCSQQVEVTADEADLLASLVLGGVKIDREKMKRQAGLKHTTLTWWRQEQSEKACLFLGADNSCRVYYHRPMACRKYFVETPPEKCAEVSAEGSIQVGVIAIPNAEIIATAIQDFVRGEANMPTALWERLK